MRTNDDLMGFGTTQDILSSQSLKNAWAHTSLFLKRMGIVLLAFSLCRLLFYTLNASYFEGASLMQAFVGGIRFDLTAIAILNTPVLLLSLLPIRWIQERVYQRFLLSLIALINLPAIAFNLIDTEYFKFTSKRSTADLFELIFLGDDVLTLLPSYLKDYWYLLFILAIVTYMIIRTVRRSDFRTLRQYPFSFSPLLLMLILTSGLFVILSRGGLQLRPLSELSAMNYGRPQDMPLVLNTPFTMIRSIGKGSLEKKDYFENEELESIYSPIYSAPKSPDAEQLNVMVIIMESFSKEYVGRRNKAGLAYAPFLDSLSQVGSSIPHSYANGRKSMEALPAIIAGIPALMTDPFITSPYASNPIDGLPALLKPHGYKSLFFHGGTTGTMGFDRMSRSAGFDDYLGLEDYPDETDYDGTWGIYDGPFFQYAAKKMATLNEPFITSFFSLSSHHPYSIPSSHAGQYDDFEEGLPRTIRYADDALKAFFEQAKQSAYFDRTLFVITADHIPDTQSKEFRKGMGRYAVPLVFYRPGHALDIKTTVGQHTDIIPTVLDILGTGETAVSFGKSLVSGEENWAVQYINGLYQLRKGETVILFDGEKIVETTTADGKKKPAQSDVDEAERLLKAIIQQFTDRMIENKLTSSPKSLTH